MHNFIHLRCELNNIKSMKKSIFTKFLAVAAVLLVVTSCAKYDEGSNFSIFTAKARLVNTWTQSSSLYTYGSSSTSNTGFTEVIVTFAKDGTYTYVGKFGGGSFSESGTWVFSDDKSQVIMTESGGDVETWSIVKLKNKELKVTTPYLGGTLTFEFTGS